MLTHPATTLPAIITTCVPIPAAFGEEDDGTWDFYESSGNCGSTDSEVSWYFTTDGTTDFVQFSPQAIEYIDYLVYQVDEDCGFDGYNCEGYFDALEMSVLAGVNVGGGGSWALYGPPAIAYLVDQIEQDALAYQGAQCIYPTAESSTYSLKENTSSGFYGAGFKMALTVPGSANLSGRQVQETLSNVTTSCLSGLPCNPYGTIGPCWTEYSDYPSPSFPAGDTWNVHSGNIYGDGTSGPDGPDYMGENVTQANYYQNILNNNLVAACTMYTVTQAMTMSSCTAGTFTLAPPSQYDTGHLNWFNIGNDSMTGSRQNVQGAAQ